MVGVTQTQPVVVHPVKWLPERVEAWLREACETAKRLAGPSGRPKGYRCLIEAGGDPDLAYAYNEITIRPGPALPDAVQRHDQVMRWLGWLAVPDRRVAIARGCGLSYGRIARFDGRTAEGVRLAFRNGMLDIAARLNLESTCETCRKTA